MIKNIKPKRNRKGKPLQGYYPINECKKFIGKGPVIYRSNLEKQFCDYCERSNTIKSWDSESLEIKYFNSVDEKYHRYYPDFIVKTSENLTIVIEVKPLSQTMKPKKPIKDTKKALNRYKKDCERYRINVLKFNAALKLCADKGWVFRIITEDFFKIKK